MRSLDGRDHTKAPPAILDVESVLRMRAMIKDAKANGDKPWPYGAWKHHRGDWVPGMKWRVTAFLWAWAVMIVMWGLTWWPVWIQNMIEAN